MSFEFPILIEVKEVSGHSKNQAPPVVSILVLTFNQASFIQQCIESLLNQKTDFNFEIVIGEDDSTDGTREICKKLLSQYPEKIKLLLHWEINKIKNSLGNPTGKFNLMYSIQQCSGKYIAFCEGDDYWTDSCKLQKQADFLGTHLTASACFHNAEIIFEDGSNRPTQLVNSPNQALWTNTVDFFKEKETWFMATASVMMRRKFVNPLPSWFKDCKSGDIPMYVILAERGPIGYIPEIMSVYRKHVGGQSYTDSIKSKEFLLNRILMSTVLNEYTNKKYNEFISPILADYHEMVIHCDDYRWSLKQKQRHLMLSSQLW